MSTTATEAPQTEAKPSSFSAALEQAFKDTPVADAPPAETPKADTPPPESKTPPKEQSKTPPDELFKKPDTPKSQVDEIGEPPKLDAKGKAGWEALKQSAKEEASKRAALEKQIEEWKSKGRDPETLEKQLAERDKRLSEYEERVARADLELTDSFKRDIIEPRQKELARAKALAEEMEVNPDEVKDALNLKGKARSAALRELGIDPDGGRISRITDRLDELSEKAESERANAKQSLAQRQEQERLRQIAEHGELVKRKFLEFDDTTRRLKSELEVLNRAEGHDEWNARSESIVKNARDYMDANPHADPEAVIRANAMSAYRDLFLAERDASAAKDAKMAEMEAELKAIHSKSPGMRGGGTQAPVGAKRTFSQQISEAFGQ